MFPPILEDARAKINLALHVLGRRPDGYHELDSIVAFADIADTLLFEPDRQTTLNITGPHAADIGNGPDNLVLRALHELGQHMKVPAMRITLNKILPVASGMGGGSADAAAVLRGVLRACHNAIDRNTLQSVARSLGADVPACLSGQSCRMRGIGETISPFAPSTQFLVLVNPMVPCPTAAVFKALALKPGQSHLGALDPQAPSTWRNDLTDAALKVCPIIRDVLAALHEAGGLTSVRMSGSGATCFGAAPTMARAEAAAATIAGLHPGWWVRATRIV